MNTARNRKNPKEFVDFLDPADILCQTPITTRDELIMEMLKRLAFNHGIGNVPAIFEAVKEREQFGASIVSRGIAIPHARINSIRTPFVAVATNPKGVKFTDGGDDPVKLVLLVLVPKDQPSVYLQIIAALAKVFQTENAADNAASLATTEALVNFFRRGGLVLPNFICAGDIMAPVTCKLNDTNSLKDAIDMFVARNVLEIPVVDKDGDLTGVVTADALLRVCMPDYLLWMDDLSPILLFEPFVNVLRNEESTWLAEILHHEFSAVQIDQPAIAVAETMAKRNASTCYIVKDKQLLGQVTLPHFLNKVLRD
ncbi:MAG: PTS sugar transporter subunit IIA [Kiritimatiellia bacterium]|jgi:PTS system nitrogen regulatory IIA component